MSIEALLARKVLVLNKQRQAIGETTVSEALVDMCSGKAVGIDMDTLLPVKWNDWLKLSIRDGDSFIRSLRGHVRVPTVVGKFAYEKMPKKRPKLDNRGIKDRDRAICQITGEYAPDGNVDHVVPKSRGGSKKSWDNMVWMKRGLNTLKGNRTLAEMGWKLLRTPQKPPDKAICLLIPERYPDWRMFLPSSRKQ